MLQTPLMIVAAVAALAVGVLVDPPSFPAIAISVPAPAMLLADAPQINTGENNGGTIGNYDPSPVHAAQYGPVDQSKPLDFTTQPPSVPRNYIGGRLYNIQALKGKSYPQVLGLMGQYSSALGVACTYCHNAGNFAYDTPTKKIARTMIVMTGRVQNDWSLPSIATTRTTPSTVPSVALRVTAVSR